MKNKLTAFLTTGIMLASALPMLPVQAEDVTEEDNSVSSIPEWIPTSFDEAFEFRSTYGATHIGKNEKTDDTVCIVFPESSKYEYTVLNGNNELTEIYHESFTDESSGIKYEVAAYTLYHQNAGLCSFAIELLDDKEECISDYHFNSYGVRYIEEDDVYSWLPDCKTEYDEYLEKNGELSVKDGYVVFCLKTAKNGSYDWMNLSSYPSSVYEIYDSDCSDERLFTSLDGGEHCCAVAYSFKEDGRAKIKLDLVPMINRVLKPEDIVRSLCADCMVLDNCSTVLLKGNVRYTFKDYDTGKNLKLPNSSVNMDVSPSIGYKTDTEGVYIYEDAQVTADSNPYIWRNKADKNADVFDVELNEKAIPYGYKLPADYKTITSYENGSYDVEFRLKQDDDSLPPDTVRITLYDKDTGEFIPDEILKLHPFMICTDIRFADPSDPERMMYTGPIIYIDYNQQIIKDNLASLYRSADYFAFISKYQPEIKLYDNNSLDLIFRMKIETYGDINGDGGFTIADLVMLQKWLLTGEGNEYSRWYDGDFCTDGKIDVFDLCIMRKKLIDKINNTYTDFNTKIVSTKELNGYAGYYQKNLIKNTEELEGYMDSKKDILDLTEFKEASKGYDAEWFKDHQLIVLTVESTEDVYFNVKGIIKGKADKYKDATYDCIEIEQVIPEDGCWGKLITHPQILIELDSSFEISNDFEADFIVTQS